jgi:VWFA-related protein
MHSLCKATAAVLALSQLCFAALGQSKPSSPASGPTTPLFRSSSNLVLVDVVVIHRDKPVLGVERVRFHIFDDGAEQPIESFDEHAPDDRSSAVAIPQMFGDIAAPHTFTNISPYPAKGTVNVLLLDALNTPLANQLEVRRQMIEYMAKIEPGTSLAIFTLSSRLRLVEGFTTDAAQLASAMKDSAVNAKASAMLDPASDQALDATIGDAAGMGVNTVDAQSNLVDPIASMLQFQADLTAFQTDQRVRMTMEAMQQLARYFSGIPGRKNLIWFSASFPLMLDPNDALESPFEGMRNYAEQIRETSELLSAARVAVYPVDAKGLATPPSFDASYTTSTNLVSATANAGRGGARSRRQANKPNPASDVSRQLQESLQEEATLDQVAMETGGKVYRSTNDLREAVADAAETGASYYTIGFSPAALNGQFHKLRVSVDNSEYKLAYRSGYFADLPKHSPASSIDSSLIAATSLHGAPASTQILFEARILDSNDPKLRGSRLPEGPAGELVANLKQPTRRVIVDVKADLAGLALEQTSEGSRSGKIEFVLIAYDAEGKRINYFDKGFQLNLMPQQYAGTLANGIPIRMALDLPTERIFLRIAVHDLNSGKVGSLEVQLAGDPGHGKTS